MRSKSIVGCGVGLVLMLALVTLTGCGAGAATPATSNTSSGESYTSKVLVTSYQGALSASDQLIVGTLQLEGTDQAVTTEQAKTLLPLWQALQGEVVTAGAERSAMYTQIEAQMTQAQLAAIAAMQLTQEDTAQGQGGPPGGSGPSDMTDEQRAAMRATAEAGGMAGPGGGGLPNMTDEQRAAMRATIEAGGGPPGGGPPGNMTDEQRAAMRATAEAGGMSAPGGGVRPGGGRMRQNNFLLESLIRLLTQRASGNEAPPAPAS